MIYIEEATEEMKSKLNDIKNRILFIPPKVAELEENEGKSADYQSMTNDDVGKGAYGKVYKVRHKISRMIYAIKVINKKKVVEDQIVDQVRLEVNIMYKLDHPHIIKLCSHFEDEKNFYLVLEYAPGGQIYSKCKFPEWQAAEYMREICSAVEYLHNHDPPIIHRDIKPENILLDAEGKTKLADFGWSNFNKGQRKTFCGTPEYLAPEMISQEGHNQGVDLWCLGILLFELLTGHPPFKGENQFQLFFNIQGVDKLSIYYPIGFSNVAKNLVSKLLKSNPAQRISMQEMKSHPWFKCNMPKVAQQITSNLGDKGSEIQEEEKSTDYESDETKLQTSNNILRDKIMKKMTAIGKPNENILKVIEHKDKIIEDKLSSIKHKDIQIDNLKQELKNSSKKLERISKRNRTHELKMESYEKQEIRRLEEEVQKLSLLNKDRDKLFDTIDSLNNTIFDYESKLKLSENHVERANTSKEMIESKYGELLGKFNAKEETMIELNKYIKNIKYEKAQMEVEFENKIDLLQYQLISREPSEDSASKLGQVMDLSNSLLEGIMDKLQKEQINLSKNNEEVRKELFDLYEKQNTMRIDYESQIFELNINHTNKLDECRNESQIAKKNELRRKDEIIKELKLFNLQIEKKQMANLCDIEHLATLEKLNKQNASVISDSELAARLKSQELTFLKGKNRELLIRVDEMEYQLAVEKNKNLQMDIEAPVTQPPNYIINLGHI